MEENGKNIKYLANLAPKWLMQIAYDLTKMS